MDNLPFKLSFTRDAQTGLITAINVTDRNFVWIRHDGRTESKPAALDNTLDGTRAIPWDGSNQILISLVVNFNTTTGAFTSAYVTANDISSLQVGANLYLVDKSAGIVDDYRCRALITLGNVVASGGGGGGGSVTVDVVTDVTWDEEDHVLKVTKKTLTVAAVSSSSTTDEIETTAISDIIGESSTSSGS